MTEQYKVVPVEPTDEMSAAGKYAMKGSADVLFERERAEIVYGAVVESAPAFDGVVLTREEADSFKSALEDIDAWVRRSLEYGCTPIQLVRLRAAIKLLGSK